MRLQFARGDHFGEQHRRRLQRLDFLLGIGAPHLVLHDQHAERIAAAQDRHAEEGVIDLLAGLRTIGEGRMLLRLGQGERLGALRDQADEALAGLHGGQMDGLAVQALGGVKFKPLVGAQHIDRTHLRHHIGGDLHDDLVEPRLRVHRLRADFAQPAQQQARSAVSAPHRVYSCSTAAWRTPPTLIYYYYIPARSLATRPWPAYIAALRPPQGSGVDGIASQGPYRLDARSANRLARRRRRLYQSRPGQSRRGQVSARRDAAVGIIARKPASLMAGALRAQEVTSWVSTNI